ncbi:MAG: phosphoethanolamine transferase [Pseudomonadota bacterium]|nr:phosphoethanolamine transferase [Pseudomonadota bacterium]
MRFLSRSLLTPLPLFVLLTYAALSSMAFLPWALNLPLERPAQLLAIAFIGWLALWSVFKRPAYFHWLLLPAFMAVPVNLYLYTYYSQGISTHHLGILFETSPAEALDFLGNKIWLLGGVMVAMLAWWAGSWYAACKTRALDWVDPSRYVVLAILSVALGAGWWTRHDVETGHPTPLPVWARIPLDADAFAASWPFGLAARGYDFYNERRYLAELSERSARFRFGAYMAQPMQEAPGADGRAEGQTIVVVIGESSRYDRWSLNGYARKTNPLLEQEPNIVSMRDLITAVSATRLSVPVIVSRKPATQSLKAGFAEKSFLTAFREAGYKTWWLSNQISFGKFDTPVSVLAREANIVEFLNPGGFSDRSNLDDVLLAPLQRAMADPAPLKLVVIHSMGSHWNYAHRYPKQFDQWQPSLTGVDKPVYTDLKIKPQLNNSYDNAILYTDWFLAQVVKQLKTAPQPAAMAYVADHGQTLYDGSCRVAFHGHNSQYEFHVPALFWYSDAYAALFPDKVAQLKAHRKARLSTENIFDTVVDLGDIRYPNQRFDWSIASPALKSHPRYVDSYGWTNYDAATPTGDCREMLAKGKVLTLPH